MDENNWFCERCGNEFDLAAGEGWVRLVEEEHSSDDGKLFPVMPLERVCYNCADDLYAIVEKCDKSCHRCEATIVWGLSIKDCLKFQLKFDLLDLPQPQGQVAFMGSLYGAEESLRMFRRL